MLPPVATPAIVPAGTADWAVLQAQAALAEGKFAAATTWLRRADRLVDNDATIQLMLASARAHEDPDEAVSILTALTARVPDDRNAALALAATLLRAGRPDAAALRLGTMLERAALTDTDTFRAVAAAICKAVRAPGWIQLDGTGTCHFRLTDAAPTASVQWRLDGGPAGTLRIRPGRQASLALPDPWRRSRLLTVTCGGQALIGSGLRPSRFGEVEGFVGGSPEGAVQGWATLPADPTTRPVLFLREPNGTMRPIAFGPESDTADGDRPVSRWRFTVPADVLAGLTQVGVVGPEGRDLWGSPLLLGVEQEAARRAAQALASCIGTSDEVDGAVIDRFRPLPAALLPVSPRTGAEPVRRPPCDVIVPVYAGLAELDRCLDSLAATLPATSRLILINDGSPDPAIANRLLAAAGPKVTLLQHERPRGFPAAINAGLRHLGPAPERDVVILNADTVVSAQWLARLGTVAHADPAIGSVTPLTNDGTIVSYPTPGEPGTTPGLDRLAALNRLCWSANGALPVTIPTGVGFCMLMKGACLAEVGLFREDVFAQGYGEENDWCLRAAHLGWRHVAAPGVFVGHSGGRSFGAAKSLLLERNGAVLERLHPGYTEYVQVAMAAEPLLAARRRIDRLMLLQDTGRPAVALITHDAGGGVARLVASRCAAIAASGRRPIVLSPDEDRPGSCDITVFAEKGGLAFPNLRFDLPAGFDELAALLRLAKVEAMEFHHLLHHDWAVCALPAAIGVPYDVVVHDYGHWCPRISLTSRGNRYCGEPLLVQECEECVADLGSRYEDGLTVRSLRDRSAHLLGQARRVTVSCEDVATRIRRQFPSVRPQIEAWEGTLTRVACASMTGGAVHVIVVGAIGIEKGYDVLLACARDAARRDLNLRFTVVGYTIDDDRLMATGRVFVTGRFEESEGVALARAQAGTIGFVPSVCPETWSFALSLLWQAGLSVLGFALGAQGERIGRSGAGWLLPLGLAAGKVNDALVSRGLETVQATTTTAIPQGI